MVLEAAREAVAREQEGVDVGDRHDVRRAAGVVQQPELPEELARVQCLEHLVRVRVIRLGLELGLGLGFVFGLG